MACGMIAGTFYHRDCLLVYTFIFVISAGYCRLTRASQDNSEKTGNKTAAQNIPCGSFMQITYISSYFPSSERSTGSAAWGAGFAAGAAGFAAGEAGFSMGAAVFATATAMVQRPSK